MVTLGSVIDMQIPQAPQEGGCSGNLNSLFPQVKCVHVKVWEPALTILSLCVRACRARVRGGGPGSGAGIGPSDTRTWVSSKVRLEM